MTSKTASTRDFRPALHPHGRRAPRTGTKRPDFSARDREVPRSPVVLVVSADSLLRWALYEALANAHFLVLTCSDEAHAHEILPWIDVNLSLAIVDDECWAMTKSARDWLHVRWPELPILVLAHPEERLEHRVKGLGLAGVLVKPFDVSELIATVSRIVAPHAETAPHAEHTTAG